METAPEPQLCWGSRATRSIAKFAISRRAQRFREDTSPDDALDYCLSALAAGAGPRADAAERTNAPPLGSPSPHTTRYRQCGVPRQRVWRLPWTDGRRNG